MALMDRLATFGENVDLSQTTGTYVLTNQIDLQAAAIDVGNGKPLYLNIVVDEAFSTGSSPTIEFQLVSDDNAALSSPTIHLSSGAIAAANLTLNKRLSFAIPASGLAFERYLGVRALIAVATTTTGTVTAWLGWEPCADIKHYADATN